MRTTHLQLFNRICDGIERASSGSDEYLQIYKSDPPKSGRHEFLFFLKPELTAHFSIERFRPIFEMIADKIDTFKLGVDNVFILPGEYLKKYGIMSEHYGVIDAVARRPIENFSEQAQKSFAEHYGTNAGNVNVIGAFEYLRRHPELGPDAMASIWLSRGYQKLAGGTYAEFFADENLYLVNGFYPRLLNHFTKSDSCIVSFVLLGDLPWRDARRKFVGATNPGSAESGSIRADLLARQSEFGLEEISANLNGVHLSAGPVEGLVELRRFTADLSKGRREQDGGVFRFKEELSKAFSRGQIEKILNNVNVKYNAETVSIFDLTEEMDADDALVALRDVSRQLV